MFIFRTVSSNLLENRKALVASKVFLRGVAAVEALGRIVGETGLQYVAVRGEW